MRCYVEKVKEVEVKVDGAWCEVRGGGGEFPWCEVEVEVEVEVEEGRNLHNP